MKDELIKGRFVTWGYNYGQIVSSQDELTVEKLIGSYPYSVQRTGKIIRVKRDQVKLVCKPRLIHRA